VYDWLRNPNYESSVQPKYLTLREEEEHCELQSDHTLKIRFNDLSLDKFWISEKERYPAIHGKAIYIAITCLTSIKSKDTNHLISVENELCVCLSMV
jgi:hypothetical protein